MGRHVVAAFHSSCSHQEITHALNSCTSSNVISDQNRLPKAFEDELEIRTFGLQCYFANLSVIARQLGYPAEALVKCHLQRGLFPLPVSDPLTTDEVGGSWIFAR